MRYNSYYFIYLIRRLDNDELILKAFKDFIINDFGAILNNVDDRNKEASKKYYYFKRMIDKKGRAYVLRELEKHYANIDDKFDICDALGTNLC